MPFRYFSNKNTKNINIGFLPWLILLIIFVGAILASALFVFGFRDPQESSKVPMIVSAIGITVTFTTICLVPLDVFTTSQMIDPTIINALFKIIYFGYNAILLIFHLFCFLKPIKPLTSTFFSSNFKNNLSLFSDICIYAGTLLCWGSVCLFLV